MSLVHTLGRVVQIPNNVDIPFQKAPQHSQPYLIVKIGDLIRPDRDYSLDSAVSLQLKGNVVSVIPKKTIGPRAMDHYIADHAIHNGLGALGDTVFHAAGLTKNNIGVIISGVSGKGKSTTTAFLSSRGWSVLGDDAIRAQVSKDICKIWPSYNGFRVHPDVIGKIIPPAKDEQTSLVAEYANKLRVHLDSSVYYPLMTECHLFIELGNDADWSVKMVGEAESCSTVAKHFFHPPDAPHHAIDRLESSIPIARALKVYQVDFPRSLNGLGMFEQWLSDTANLC